MSIWVEYVKEHGTYDEVCRLRDYLDAEFQLLSVYLFRWFR